MARRRLAVTGMLLLPACATIPDGQRGIEDINWQGVDQMSSKAVEACLATQAREDVTLRLGLSAASCGNPPFDDTAPELKLGSWPWTRWPVYDPAIVNVDKERIVRWYQARGYYDASVTNVVATNSAGKPVESYECESDDCVVELLFEVEEGLPVEVTEVEVQIEGELQSEVAEALKEQPELLVGERFDEHTYEADKDRLKAYLRRQSYARAEVSGEVVIDRGRRTARIEYRANPGPPCVFGDVTVKEEGEVPADLILQAASIPSGEPYSYDLIDDAQRAIFALGVFSSVQIEERYPGDANVVDLVVTARPGRLVIPSAGIGVMSGTLRRTTSDEVFSVPQWDVHLRFSWEHRNLFGGLRRLRIEERPRLIMLDDFPQVPTEGPALGNVLSITFEQPSTFEARTVLFSENEWDLGPDAFYGYFRHELANKVGLRRAFFKQRLHAHVAVQHDLYEIIEQERAPDTVSSYRLPFLEQQVRLDLRDDSRRPTTGLYASATVQEALRIGGYGSWNYIRVTPDLRGYVPVVWGVVLAARFALGALYVLDASSKLDETSQSLGPQGYRLRGGGANSNRGFHAGELGDGLTGGNRRYEGSLELRIPIGGDLGAALFGDVGDVSGDGSFRFKELNTSAGLGLRYYTLFGALRVDAAWRIPGLQRVGQDAETVELEAMPSAFHLTIGEAF